MTLASSNIDLRGNQNGNGLPGPPAQGDQSLHMPRGTVSSSAHGEDMGDLPEEG